MNRKYIDLAEEWLREHDPCYPKYKSKGEEVTRIKDYVYLTKRQIERRQKREIPLDRIVV